MDDGEPIDRVVDADAKYADDEAIFSTLHNYQDMLQELPECLQEVGKAYDKWGSMLIKAPAKSECDLAQVGVGAKRMKKCLNYSNDEG